MYIFDFDNLKRLVTQRFGVDPDSTVSSFEPPPKITKELNKQEFKRSISFDFDNEGGIFYTDGIKTYKGFLYIPIYNQRAAQRKGWNTMPKFHITKCSIIENQMNRSNFNGHYVFANTPVTNMTDVDGTEKDLKICGYCVGEVSGVHRDMTTTEYYEKFILNDEVEDNFAADDIPDEAVETNIWGYTPDWYEKSRNYRHEQGYCCENCDIKLDASDGYYLDTHHINGNKTNNNSSNLLALCVLCHANFDAHHLRNFSVGRNKIRLEEFVTLFRKELQRVENDYIPRFLD